MENRKTNSNPQKGGVKIAPPPEKVSASKEQEAAENYVQFVVLREKQGSLTINRGKGGDYFFIAGTAYGLTEEQANFLSQNFHSNFDWYKRREEVKGEVQSPIV